MKPEEQRKREYEGGYKCAIDKAKKAIRNFRNASDFYDWEIRAMFSCAAALIVAETDWGKGYEQALLDIKNGKIKLEADE